MHSSTQVGHVLARVQGGLSALDCALAQGHHKVSGLETVPMLLRSVAKYTHCLSSLCLRITRHCRNRTRPRLADFKGSSTVLCSSRTVGGNVGSTAAVLSRVLQALSRVLQVPAALPVCVSLQTCRACALCLVVQPPVHQGIRRKVVARVHTRVLTLRCTQTCAPPVGRADRSTVYNEYRFALLCFALLCSALLCSALLCCWLHVTDSFRVRAACHANAMQSALSSA